MSSLALVMFLWMWEVQLSAELLRTICSCLTFMYYRDPFPNLFGRSKTFSPASLQVKTNAILLLFLSTFQLQFWLKQQSKLPGANPSAAWRKGRRRKREWGGEETDKWERSKVREWREEGKRKPVISFWHANTLWICLLLYLLTSETFSSPELPVMSPLLSVDGFTASQHCLLVKTQPLPLPRSLSSHLLWYVTHSFHYYSETPEEATLPGSVFCQESIRLNIASLLHLLPLFWLPDWCFSLSLLSSKDCAH